MFLQYSGISDSAITRISSAVSNRWLEAVGVYLVNGLGKRFMEIEIAVDWRLHSDLAAVTPTITTDLPGWKDGASPEVRTLGHRLGREAMARGISPHYWVRFAPSIRSNPIQYESLCKDVGVSYGSSPPGWATPPKEKRYSVLDLNEVTTYGREV